MKIETIVTLPDGTVTGMAVSISEELYSKAEIPSLIHDTMSRVGRAISRKLTEQDKV